MNGRRFFFLLIAMLLLFVLSPSALAAGDAGGGGVHFGPYTLGEGESVNGDLVVVGPVVLGSDSTFEGDLSVFGPFTMKEGAVLDGDLAVFGEATIAGTITGDCSIAGPTTLQDSTLIEGDLNVAGTLAQAEGATVYGDITENSGEGVGINLPPGIPYAGTFQVTPPSRSGIVLHLIWEAARSGILLIVALLFALLIVSIWPKEMETIGDTIVAAPPITFGIGLAVLVVAFIVILLLIITICLSPIAFIVAIAVGVGAAVGWVALGARVGRVMIELLHPQKRPSMLVETLFGVFFLTGLALLINLVSDCLFVIIVWPLAALGMGAVLLTRFGTEPYTGGPIFPSGSQKRESLPEPAPTEPPTPTG